MVTNVKNFEYKTKMAEERCFLNAYTILTRSKETKYE